MSRFALALTGAVLLVAVPATAQARTEPAPLPGIPAGIEVQAPGDVPSHSTRRADVTGDGHADVITASGGSHPTVTVRDPRTGHVVERLHPFGAHDGGHGLQFGVGDVDGDGQPDIVVAAGPGGQPRVEVFSGTSLHPVHGFFAFDPQFTGGVNLAVGDVTGDGRADIVVGAGPGGGPDVRVFDAAGRLRSDFFAFDPAYRGGVAVSVG
jgi:hypothetical protein